MELLKKYSKEIALVRKLLEEKKDRGASLKEIREYLKENNVRVTTGSEKALLYLWYDTKELSILRYRVTGISHLNKYYVLNKYKR